MPEILDDIAYLSQEIGPRPAGTEEEQQAALYISDRFKKHVGLRAQIEDFSCNSNVELVNVILCALPILFSILSMIRNIFVVPTILISLVCAVLFVMEIMNKPILSRAFQRGVSQNVVAKYRPSGVRGKRSRKVILVANYDSGKIQNELGFAGILPILQKISSIALLLIPIIWIIRAIGFLGATGTPLVVWNVITVIALILAALPIVLFIMHKTAQYNEAANSNASGVAALLEVAYRIANTPEEDEESEAEIHGEEAAREAGLIPEGADVNYKVKANAEPEMTEAERLNAAKAAVAALTGKPLREYAPVEEELQAAPLQDMPAEMEEPFAEPAFDQPVQAAEAFEAAAEPAAEDITAEPVAEEAAEQDVPAAVEQPYVADTVGTPIPDWYRKAQEKAQKPAIDDKPVRRSKFASALDEAVAVSHEQFAAANLATDKEETFFNQYFNDGITEVAPLAAGEKPPVVEPAPKLVPTEQTGFMSTEEELASMNFDDFADLPPFDMDLYAPKPGDEDYEDTMLAADFMIEKPSMPKASDDEQTAPIPMVEQAEAPVESVVSEDEYIPGSTTAMAPIDVSQFREQSVRDLQSKPSLNVERAERRNVDRVVIDGTGEIPEVVEEIPAAREVPQLDLPDVESSLPPISELQKQRAPLADSSNPSLSSQIPRINLDAFGVSTSGNAEPLDNKRAALRTMLPSMSGSITVEPDLKVENKSAVSMTGSFAPISSTGSVGPVGDELVEGMDPDEIYIDDADDSFTETTMTETGAYAGPGYMEMPESRASRFFSRFHKKNKRSESRSAQEWLDVEDDFNPTEVGAARGGWESFAEEDEGRSRSNRRNTSEFLDEDEWNGGAFSKIRSAIPGGGDEEGEEAPAPERAPRSARRAPRSESRAIDREIRQVQDFHSKKMEMEVWFVALGSEYAGNGGMKAFLDEHAGDLRGSVVINLDSLGGGTFTFVDSEGAILQKSPSTRLRRYIKNAQAASGVSITDGSIKWRDSAASIALKRGLQGMSLVGMDGTKPALMGRGDDVLENIDVEALESRVDFVEALVRLI